jgi:hypothetical protein
MAKARALSRSKSEYLICGWLAIGEMELPLTNVTATDLYFLRAVYLPPQTVGVLYMSGKLARHVILPYGSNEGAVQAQFL